MISKIITPMSGGLRGLVKPLSWSSILRLGTFLWNRLIGRTSGLGLDNEGSTPSSRSNRICALIGKRSVSKTDALGSSPSRFAIMRGGAVGSSSGSYPEGRGFKSPPRYHWYFLCLPQIGRVRAACGWLLHVIGGTSTSDKVPPMPPWRDHALTV